MNGRGSFVAALGLAEKTLGMPLDARVTINE